MNPHLQLHALNPFGIEVRPSTREESVEALSEEFLEGLLSEHKLVLLRGFSSLQKEEFLQFCHSFRRRSLLHWSFGPVMEMHERPDPQNYLFSREKVPFHWDGAFATVPNYLVFQCVEAPAEGAGGETLFTDTEEIWQSASTQEKEWFERAELRYETEKLAHYGGSIEGPLKQQHRTKKTPILRYAEPVETALNPVGLTVQKLSDLEALQMQKSLQHKIYNDRFCYQHTWKTGDVLIADNYSLIHGRRAFESGSPRHLRRIQLV